MAMFTSQTRRSGSSRTALNWDFMAFFARRLRENFWQSRGGRLGQTESRCRKMDERCLCRIPDAQTIHAIDLDKDGAASHDRVVVSKIAGAPGGIRADTDGNIYVAARHVFVYSSKGEPVRTIELPETPSNLAFGDPELQTLYVTAQTSIYRVKVGVKGAISYLP